MARLETRSETLSCFRVDLDHNVRQSSYLSVAAGNNYALAVLCEAVRTLYHT